MPRSLAWCKDCGDPFDPRKTGNWADRRCDYCYAVRQAERAAVQTGKDS